ncbi:unnamed protein product [Peniophora sp. CBMAI 1063]|nr:unnamed protein product [Peniophora sp. CBMAI 1063]
MIAARLRGLRLAPTAQLSLALARVRRPQPCALRYSSSSGAVPISNARSVNARPKNAGAHRSGRSCSCGRQLSAQWYTDAEKDKEPMCIHCYYRRRRERANADVKVSCLDCGTGTSYYWYKHPESGKIGRCSTCYRRDRKGHYRCRTCYLRENNKSAVFVGRSCVECGSGHERGGPWYRHRSSDGNWDNSYICKPCWRRLDRARKRKARRHEETRGHFESEDA